MKTTHRKRHNLYKSLLVAVALAVMAMLGGSALGQEWTPDKDQVVEQPKPYSPSVDHYCPQEVFFGDSGTIFHKKRQGL